MRLAGGQPRKHTIHDYGELITDVMSVGITVIFTCHAPLHRYAVYMLV